MNQIDPILLVRSLESISDVVMIYDRLLRPVFANAAAARIGSSQACRPDLEQVLARQAPIQTMREIAVEGERRIYDLAFTPVTGSDGRVQFIVSIWRDVSRLHLASMPAAA